MKGSVSVQLTNGFGNNIFQYVAARLLAEHLDSDLVLIPPTPNYYAIQDLKELNIPFNNVERTQIINVKDSHYKACFDDALKGRHVSQSRSNSTHVNYQIIAASFL